MSSFADVVAPLADKVPKDNDVVAGWTGFAVFVFLAVAVALLLWSFTRHLRKAREHFGVQERPDTIPLAGTEEGDRALAEALLARDEPDQDPDRHRAERRDDEPPRATP